MDADMQTSTHAGREPLPEACALHPLDGGRGVFVHPAADRTLATEQWLLSTLPAHRQQAARDQWTEHRVAMLPMGTLMCAVRLPARLVLAVTGGNFPSGEVDRMLEEILEGGPVICDPPNQRYYALVPASVPRTWTEALDDWQTYGVDCLGHGRYLGVPRLDVTRYDHAHGCYWSVPMPSMATLCAPLRVARLIAAGVHQLAEEDNADAG
jgi:hypothetical protein